MTMIDFSKDAQSSKQLTTKQNGDEKKTKQTNERNMLVDYDFADRDAAKQVSSEAKQPVMSVNTNNGQGVREKEARPSRRKQSRKFDKKLQTTLGVSEKHDADFTK